MKSTTLLLCNLLLCYIIIASTSCSLLKKHKTIYKSSIDSTSQVVEKKDSSVIKDIVAVSKDSSKTSDEIVIEFFNHGSMIFDDFDSLMKRVKDQPFDTGVRKYRTTADDYFTITREGIKTNKPIKSVRIKSSQNVFNYDSLANHSKIQESEVKQSDTHVTKEEQKRDKETTRKGMPLLTKILLVLALIGIAAILYIIWYVRRKKKQIKEAAKLIIPPPIG